MNKELQKQNASKFVNYWKEKGYEKGESQPFWLALMRDVLGVENPEQHIIFEDQVKLDHTAFIDGRIPESHVLIEQKSRDKDLRKAIRQSDGSLLTPFQQAKRYSSELPYSQRPRWIVACNFQEFLIYDMEQPNGIKLNDLPKEAYRLNFIVNSENEQLKREMELSIAAGELVGILYDALLKQYKDPTNEHTLQSLNVLCVRLIFLLYAEDAGVLGDGDMFHDYLAKYDERTSRQALIDLFKVLDQKEEDRDPYLPADLLAFPYVNGGLFADETIEIPTITDEIRSIILSKASEDFDWSDISPTIFGGVFESTLNPETRRAGGMHYTSIENIHKVIDPLFLDSLKEELQEIKNIGIEKTRKNKLLEFQNKLASLKFLDPACGSGNFLTETYLSLRNLENEVLMTLTNGQAMIGEALEPIKVSLSQFYGIEVNDFAVTVAKTALWISESQMMKKTENIVHSNLDFLPLKSNVNIFEGNALRIDWNDVLNKDSCSYCLGNPPFVGGMYMSPEQRDDIVNVMTGFKSVGEMDYVSGWYKKAADYMRGTKIASAFVSTNSICQGQQATTLWKPLFEYGIKINFAYQSFIWDNEATNKAHVHCVIIGFSYQKTKRTLLYSASGQCKEVSNINQYLTDGPTVIIESRGTPICDVPPMRFGSMPRDGGGFIVTQKEKDEMIQNEPLSEKWIRQYLGAEEFLKNKSRYCLWLLGANPLEVSKCPTVKERIQLVKDFRLKSKAQSTRQFAETPSLFCQIAQPESGDYIAVPKTSSERRRYIPMGFLNSNVIASDALFLIPDAELYHFGILESNVHMAWMRTVCGRMKSDYRYSKDIVYNNFPWPQQITPEQKSRIEQTAQQILDVRSKYPECSLAILYDDIVMPNDLLEAHRANDRAVMQAYGFPIKMTESECVAELMKMYEKLAQEK